MAQIDLGKLKVTNKGVWSAGTTYEADDFVQYNFGGVISTYIYINATAAAGQVPEGGSGVNTTYWQLMAKGTATEKMAFNVAQTQSFTAVAENGYMVDTSSQEITMTLPASPARGDQVEITDYRGTFSTNPLTINRNGSKIEGYAEDWLVTAKGATVSFLFDDGISGDEGWRITKFISEYDNNYGGQQMRGPGVKNIGTKKYLIATSDAEQVYVDGEDVVHKFETSGNFKVHYLGTDTSLGDKVEYLIVGGGGGGGTHHAGGGGAGGYRANNAKDHTVTAQNYTITVGTGASERTSNGHGNNGGNSEFDTLVSGGGGGGGAHNNRGRDGGSGGGAGHSHTHGSATGQGTGHRGGSHSSHTNGGGGGAHRRGADHYGNHQGGHGGRGEVNDITGSEVWYAGGGGASGHNHTSSGAGGDPSGGHGSGGYGFRNTGGGGGGTDGTSGTAQYGGQGGNGIVVIRYKGREN